MKIGIGNDHAALEMKNQVMEYLDVYKRQVPAWAGILKIK